MILVIEDDDDIRENILEILSDSGFEAIAAPNGKIGVELAQQHKPNLIICDVTMPELGGYDVIAKLRQEPELALTPFIFLTGMYDQTSLRHGMTLGADDYLSKPISRKVLLDAINTRLEKQALINRQARSKLDALRNSISLSLPHELITPLSGILGLAQILIEEYATISPNEILEIAQDIEASGQRLNRLIQNFITYAELQIDRKPLSEDEQSKLSTETSNVIITRVAIAKAKLANREADLQLELDDEIALAVPETKLQKVLEEVIDNAFKYSVVGTPVHISSQKIDNHAVIRIGDRGRGMTAAQVNDVGGYMQFERTLYEQQGSGLGLAIVKRITELYGGSFRIESEVNVQTTVEISLPGC
ncbi:response regulator [Pseudanabaena sp. PCC 6802]|uniref:hybrid sensor histidine kinase/response regulator n=1 Tax=Pseudanabaena sp. PCC 6802 TaxID=118173 RepID=UPI00034BB0C5|nr:response regulator [Pseudanabaena sp. PCC 6802]